MLKKKCCNWLSASKNFHYVHYMEACEYLNIDQLFSIKTNNNHKKNVQAKNKTLIAHTEHNAKHMLM